MINADDAVVHHNIALGDPSDVNFDGYFWGAPGGPGPNPADSFGGICDTGSGTVTVNATNNRPKPHSIKVLPQR